MSIVWFNILLQVFFANAPTVAGDADRSRPPLAEQVSDLIQRAIDRGSVIGAQLAIGRADGMVALRQFGVIAPGSRQAVTRETLFCIGSCSKTLASACLLTLVDSGALSLEDSVDKWLEGFDRLDDGRDSPLTRPPTVRELLAHRGGIYSQKRAMNPLQKRAIRDFRLSLTDAVTIISAQPLLDVPGRSFAYSGAGYCVLGRVAEIASGDSFEALLQEGLCRPLQLARTTYFPKIQDEGIAVGGLNRDGNIVPHPASPHLLGSELRLALVGGSIYSNAEETGRFAMMVLNRGQSGGRRVLSKAAWSAFTRRQFAGKPYGLGATLRIRDGRTVSMRHFGALCSYRSMLFVNLEKGYYAVVHWTLRDPKAEDIRQRLLRIVE